jgi:DNA-directed RNA polymerase subunit beta'
MMPGVVTDADDNPIEIPVTESYSEGLTPFSYWAAGHGARGGNIKKSVQSFKPGWFTKDIMNSIYETRIEGDAPMDTEGVEVKTSNPKNIVNRFLAKDAKDKNGKIIAKRNSVVNSDTINKFNKFGIKKVNVQSPLTDPTPGDGFSPYSYGVDYNGNLPKHGDHIGIKSAHTITEPSLNLAMKAFHTGGA